MDWITIWGLIGFLATSYAIYVAKKSKSNEPVMCDINDWVSCTKVLKSDYAYLCKMYLGVSDDSPFNVPNTYYGLLLYIAIMIYPMYPFTLIPFRETLLLIASTGSMLLSFFLAFILKYKLNNLCIICVFTYVVNAAIFYLAWKEMY
jgi:vitamin-K-epoxide reductase (warfarin-sensitive)